MKDLLFTLVTNYMRQVSVFEGLIIIACHPKSFQDETKQNKTPPHFFKKWSLICYHDFQVHGSFLEEKLQSRHSILHSILVLCSQHAYAFQQPVCISNVLYFKLEGDFSSSHSQGFICLLLFCSLPLCTYVLLTLILSPWAFSISSGIPGMGSSHVHPPPRPGQGAGNDGIHFLQKKLKSGLNITMHSKF